MPKNCIVVDTNVFIDLCTADCEASHWASCAYVFSSIQHGAVRLAVDIEGKILEEYKENFNKYKKYPHTRLIQSLISKERYAPSDERKIIPFESISEKKVEALKMMKFHTKDIKFVKIAPNTDLKTVVSTDGKSFLNEGFSNWLRDNLGVHTIPPSKFGKLIRS